MSHLDGAQPEIEPSTRSRQTRGLQVSELEDLAIGFVKFVQGPPDTGDFLVADGMLAGAGPSQAVG